MIQTRNIKVKVGIEPHELTNDIEETIKEKAKRYVYKRQIKDVGYILDIEGIKGISGGDILFSNIKSVFVVVMSVKLYIPKVGEKLDTKVKSVSLSGYYVDGPTDIDVFIGTEEKPTVSEGDDIRVKITKVLFKKGKFMVLARAESS